MDKNDLRRILMLRRENIAERERKDAAIRKKVLAIAAKFPSTFIYVSMGSEVDTHAIISSLINTHSVYIPHTVGGEMHAVKYDGSPLRPDKFGNIYNSDLEFYDGQAGLTIVPLLGFNNERHRIGYGKGCYDGYFSLNPGGLKVGLAYDEQLCDFTAENTDIPVDEIITPTTEIRRTE